LVINSKLKTKGKIEGRDIESDSNLIAERDIESDSNLIAERDKEVPQCALFHKDHLSSGEESGQERKGNRSNINNRAIRPRV
jgi:hypothetical protein